MGAASGPIPAVGQGCRYRLIIMLGILFFASGAAALTYQVLWVRELGLLFGSTAEAAALTIAIFFAGIAAGGWFWGRRAGRMPRPLRAFGWLEIGVAAAALAHFLVADLYFSLYPLLYTLVGHAPLAETLLKASVAATLLLPAAFLMGGTLPLMGQHLIRTRDRLGRTGSALYAINTLGGVAGALAAGFILPLALGFRNAYLLAVGIDLAVGIIALLLARRQPAIAIATQSSPLPRRTPFPPLVWLIAVLSGMITLAVEVIWTRLFAQVLQNSAYTYALVLASFLAALALGAGLANLLNRQRLVTPGWILLGLLVTSAAIVGGTPWLFDYVTNGMSYLGQGTDFKGYVFAVAQATGLVILIPGIILGAVLPFLLRLLETSEAAPGEILGRLVAANTAGAIAGALVAGFVLLPVLGTANALLSLGFLYAALAWLLGFSLLRTGDATWGAGAGALPRQVSRSEWSIHLVLACAVVVMGVAYTRSGIELTPSPVRVNSSWGETLVALREGRAAHAAVIERDVGLSIRVNNYYTLGSTHAAIAERNQTLIPLLAHPNPESVFFLGMGTGITAGAALLLPVERVVVCEILGEVVELAREHFGPWINGLFEDPRVLVHAEDGRHCLTRTAERFDAIIADLFTPWKAGTGNLYTLEHYRLAAERLKPGGVYVQWIPLYQVSMQELAVIGATMAEVFPELTAWRGDLYPSQSIIALVGRNALEPLDPDVLVRNGRYLLDRSEGAQDLRSPEYYEALGLRFYAGNPGHSRFFEGARINTDDRPWIEYWAPRTHRAVLAGSARWVIGEERDRFYTALLDALPTDADPFLQKLNERQRLHVEAGLRFALYQGIRDRESHVSARAAWLDFLEVVTTSTRSPDSPAGQAGAGITGFGMSEGH